MDAQVIKAKMDQLQRFGQTLPGGESILPRRLGNDLF